MPLSMMEVATHHHGITAKKRYVPTGRASRLWSVLVPYPESPRQNDQEIYRGRGPLLRGIDRVGAGHARDNPFLVPGWV